MFESKIRAITRGQGDKIGFEDDNYTIDPIAAAAKGSLLPVLQEISSADSKEPSLYHLGLEHIDFGIHNMWITLDAKGQPPVASLLSCPIQRVLYASI